MVFRVFNQKSEQVAGSVIELSYFNVVNLLWGNFKTLSNFFYKKTFIKRLFGMNIAY